MRKKGIKWVIGTFSVVAVAFSVVMISNSVHAQDEDQTPTEKVKIEKNKETLGSGMEVGDLTKDRMDCPKECSLGECTNCTPEECEKFCKSKKDKTCSTTVDPGGC